MDLPINVNSICNMISSGSFILKQAFVVNFVILYWFSITPRQVWASNSYLHNCVFKTLKICRSREIYQRFQYCPEFLGKLIFWNFHCILRTTTVPPIKMLLNKDVFSSFGGDQIRCNSSLARETVKHINKKELKRKEEAS